MQSLRPSLAKPSLPNAIEVALGLYGPNFAKIHGHYTLNGFCYSQPDVLLLFRPALRSRLEEWNPDGADCWWVELAIGAEAPSIFARIVPWSLPYVGWQRGLRSDFKPRFFPFTKAKAIYELFYERRSPASCPGSG